MFDDINRECAQSDDPAAALLAQLAEDLEWLASPPETVSCEGDSPGHCIESEGEIEAAEVEEIDLAARAILTFKAANRDTHFDDVGI